MGIVYKITCETGLVYYGSSKNTIQRRQQQGWYNCACKDFKIKKIEVLEECDNYKEREDFYIRNNKCINKNVVIPNQEDKKKAEEKYKPLRIISSKNHRKRVINEKRFYCELCDLCFQSPSKLTRHNEGYRHKLKNECYLKYGEDWKNHYMVDNRRRYNDNRNNKNSKM